MWISVYEVIHVDHAMHHTSVGLYFRARKAVRVAKDLAKKEGHKKLPNELIWGLKDEYGLLNGVYITMRKIEE